MIWEIASFGDVATLNSVFNAISVIFQDGGFKAAGAAIALLAVVGSTAGSMLAGKGELPFGRLFAGMLLYTMGFSTLTSVSIENRYDGTVTQIDHIPAAIAVPASLISNVGLYLAEATETAFGVINDAEKVSHSGYLSPIKTFVTYRKIAMDTKCPAGFSASAGNGVSLCASVPTYVRDCAMVKAERDNTYAAMKEGDLVTNLQFNSAAYTTEFTDNTGTVSNMTCADAYTKINAALTGTTIENMLALFDGMANVNTGVGEDAQTKVGDALTAVGGSSGDAINLARTLFISRLVEDGTLSFYSANGASDIAENIHSSIEQRNYQWALQGELWTQIVDKFITIVECLIFAMAPLIGLVLLSGASGSRSVILYFQMLAVIQIMPPLLVIVQSILMNDMQTIYATLAAKYDVGSMQFVYQMTEEAKEMAGLGGMLASTVVPALAMSIVTGSGMAVMGAFKGAAAPAKDADAEHQVTDQGGAIENLGNMNTAHVDTHGNAITDDTKARVSDIKSGNTLNHSVNEAHAREQAATRSYQDTSSQTFKDQNNNAYSSEQMQSMGDKVISSMSNGTTWQTNTSRAIQQSTGVDKQVSDAIAAKVGLSIFGTGGSDNYTDTLSASEKEVFNKAMNSSRGDDLQAQLQTAKETMSTDGEKITTGNSEVDERSHATQKAYQEMESAKDSYNQTKSLSKELSATDTNAMEILWNKTHDGSDFNQRVESQFEAMKNDPTKANEYNRLMQNLDRVDGGIDANRIGDDNYAKAVALAMTDKGAVIDAMAGSSNFMSDDNKPQLQTTTGLDKEKEGLAFSGKPDNATIPEVKQGGVPKELNPDKKEQWVNAVNEQNHANIGAVNQREIADNANDYIEQRKAALDGGEQQVKERSEAWKGYQTYLDVVEQAEDPTINTTTDAVTDTFKNIAYAAKDVINEFGTNFGYSAKNTPDPKAIEDEIGIPRDPNFDYSQTGKESRTLTDAIGENAQKMSAAAMEGVSNIAEFFSGVGGSVATAISDQTTIEGQKLDKFLEDAGFKGDGDSPLDSLMSFAADVGEQGLDIMRSLGFDIPESNSSEATAEQPANLNQPAAQAETVAQNGTGEATAEQPANLNQPAAQAETVAQNGTGEVQPEKQNIEPQPAQKEKMVTSEEPANNNSLDGSSPFQFKPSANENKIPSPSMDEPKKATSAKDQPKENDVPNMSM